MGDRRICFAAEIRQAVFLKNNNYGSSRVLTKRKKGSTILMLVLQQLKFKKERERKGEEVFHQDLDSDCWRES